MTWPVVTVVLFLAFALVTLCALALVGANREAERHYRREHRLTTMLFVRESTPPEVRALRTLAAEAPVNGHREPIIVAEPVAEDGSRVELAGS